MYVLFVLLFVFALMVSVVLHEAGHFVTAKHYGMKATRFFAGFGPTIFSWRRGETEYGLKAIPAGGFVKIIGMTSLEEIEPGDEDRAFYRQPVRQRIVVLSAGSFMHLVIAVVVTFLVLAFVGDVRSTLVTTTVDQVSSCIKLDPNEANCTAADPKAPAAGVLEPGDRITTVDGVAVTTFAAVRARIQASAGTPLALTFVRAGVTHRVTLTPIGTVSTATDSQYVGLLGVTPVLKIQPVSVASAVPRTFGTLWDYVVATGQGLGRLPHDVAGVFEGKPRDPNGAASVVDIANVSGQIGSSASPLGQRLASVLSMMAGLNLFVGIFNMLPLLPLDGGHVAIAGYEAVRRRFALRRHRPDPGPVDMMKILPITYAAFALVVGVSLVLLYAGITSPISIN